MRLLQLSFYRKSSPEHVNYADEEGIVKNKIQMSHRYSITNTGVSPYDVSLSLIIPVEINGDIVVDILSIDVCIQCLSKVKYLPFEVSFERSELESQ